ncbi:hypothetical protein F0L68_17700 [Solihabitans fulvus]|uniref:Uncharacterized protein n=1 Tax=Solihabitans fulvus TaxID=1892852 RepID=A0A5B2XCE9_9PSEU|nr:hypothetical protein [Solihabitans fulvus]KAA2261287.1 hypothetical protein F0L68_17700 [Solihabitans fulvus]
MRTELLAHQQEYAGLHELRATASAPVDALADGLHRADSELAEADKEPDQDLRRLADRRHPDHFARARRSAEGTSRRRDAAGAQFEAQRRLGEAVQVVAALDQAMTASRQVARARVERVHAYMCRRIWNYWQHLVAAHKDGAMVNERLAPLEPPLPDLP